MDNELLYRKNENRTHCSYFSLYLSFICLLGLNVCHSFHELRKLEFSNMVYICRMSDCFVKKLRLRVMALIFLFLSLFLSFPLLHVNIKKIVSVFSQEMLKVEF